MIKCKQCEVEKDESEYYASNKGKCKECVKFNVRKNRDDKIEYYREFDKNRANLPHRVKARKEYAETARGWAKHAKAKKKYIELNPIKRWVHGIVRSAIRNGTLIKQNCEWCDTDKNIHAHHCDYAKPLDVMWLCAQCHMDWHKENESINGDIPDEDETQ
jgi:hypothetical protein